MKSFTRLAAVAGKIPPSLIAGLIAATLMMAVGGLLAPVTVLEVRAAARTLRVEAEVPSHEIRVFPPPAEERVIKPTGRVEPARARGVVRFRCCTEAGLFCFFCASGDWPDRIRIPAGTRVYACGALEPEDDGIGDRCIGKGMGYRTQAPAVIRAENREVIGFGDAAVSGWVPVVALAPGAAGNVDPGTIRIGAVQVAKGVAIYLDDKGAFGGADGTERVLTAQDERATVRAIRRALEAEARSGYEAEARRRGLVIAGTALTPTVERNPFFSDVRDPFDGGPETVRVELDARARAYAPDAVASAVMAALEEGVPDGWTLDERTTRSDPSTFRVLGDRVMVTATATIVVDLDAMIRRVEEAGLERAEELLERELGVTVERSQRFGFPLQARLRIVARPHASVTGAAT